MSGFFYCVLFCFEQNMYNVRQGHFVWLKSRSTNDAMSSGMWKQSEKASSGGGKTDSLSLKNSKNL